MKVFFSQRFHGKTEEEIFKERDAVKEYLERRLDTEVEILDQYHLTPSKNDPVTWNWTQDLLLLGTADMIVFANDYEEALGCQMEMLAVRMNGLQFIVLPKF